MTNKKVKSVEVLCAYTTKEMWDAIKQTKIATQGNGSVDAEYIAFIRLGLKENDGRGIITHYAKINKNGINSDVPIFDYCKKVSGLEKFYKEKGWNGFCKTYDLEWIKKLSNPIPHKKGDFARSQIKFCTTLDEFKKAKVLSDMKTVTQLEKNKKAYYKN